MARRFLVVDGRRWGSSTEISGVKILGVLEGSVGERILGGFLGLTKDRLRDFWSYQQVINRLLTGYQQVINISVNNFYGGGWRVFWADARAGSAHKKAAGPVAACRLPDGFAVG